MHRKSLKRITVNPLTQKIDSPEHLAALQDYHCKHESSSRIRLPSLQRRKALRENDTDVSTWDRHSTITAVPRSPDVEDILTSKLIQQWEAVEKALYNEEDLVTNNSLLEECVQWRSQIPHFRILGTNPLSSSKNKGTVSKQDGSAISRELNIHDNEAFSHHSLLGKESSISSQHEPQEKEKEKVFNLVMEHVISELFPNQDKMLNDLDGRLSKILKIRASPIHSNISSARSINNGFSYERKHVESSYSVNNYSGTGDSFMAEENKSVRSNSRGSYRSHRSSENNTEMKVVKKTSNEPVTPTEDRVTRPQMNRNKLGAVFNEKIIVSPVPYIVSTRQSFCTLRTTPIKFMNQSLAVSALPGSGRNISGFKYSARNSIASKVSDGYSAWHAPVCPTVWPKNIKLAPIDTSRLPSSKNRSATQSPILQRNRKSLSPLQRPPLPGSANLVSKDNERLENPMHHISADENSKSKHNNSRRDYSSKSDSSKKKKNRSKRGA